MKKVISTILGVSLAITLYSGCISTKTEAAVSVRLNGADLNFEDSPTIENGRVLVPFRTIFEAMGCSVEWVADENKIVATTKDSNVIELKIDSFDMTKNTDEKLSLDVAPKIRNNRTFVPVRAISEALGAKVLWDEQTNTVTIDEDLDVSVTYKDDDYYPTDWEQEAETIDLSTDGSTEITSSGYYKITGTLADGSLTVNVDKTTDDGTVYLILYNADITSLTSAPINITNGEKVVIVLPDNTQSSVLGGKDVTVDENNEPSAAIFAKSDLTITGGGKLSVIANYNDGIKSKDKLKITGGTIDITCVGDGIVGKDAVGILEGDITVNSGKDGIKSTNTKKGNIVINGGSINITAVNDAIQAEGSVMIDGGEFSISSGGGYTSVAQHTEGFKMDRGEMQNPPQMNGEQSANPDENNNHKIVNGEQTTARGERPDMNGEMPQFGGKRPNANQSTLDETQSVAANQGEQSNVEDDNVSGKGIKAAVNVIINSGSFKISSNDDAIHSNGGLTICDGEIIISSGDDAIHADSYIVINDGDISIDNCYEGIEAAYITISGGNTMINASDDAVNVNNSTGLLTISGGTVNVNSSGDGLDSNGSVKMSGGTVFVDGPESSGNGALDFDRDFSITGGTLIASGSSGMMQSPSDISTQNSVAMMFSLAQAADTKISLMDSTGNIVAECTPTKKYQSVVFSSELIESGSEYTIYVNSEEVVSFTAGENVTYVNESGITEQRQGMGGGMRGENMRDKENQSYHGGMNRQQTIPTEQVR